METIGKYQVGRLLGRGGMGTVYEATDPVIHRKVALKTMIPELVETGDLRERFLREARAAGGLRHRNIVTVYDLGEDRGQPYIAMEFIEGTDLERIIQNKEPLSIEWKLDVIRQVCEGLAHAHRNGIVHRDIKPANIRVTPEGEVKIMDFGIAHLQSSSMTKSGLVLGTVHYMAPEQVEGQKVDHRADIFSVGAIAYELVAYKKPFDGDSLTAVMFKIMRERADPAALPATEYSPGLEGIIMKALARSLNDRYQSLEELHADLERLVRDTAPRLLRGAAPAPALVGAEKGEDDKERLREAEVEALRIRVEREKADMHAEMARARTEGQLQKALGLCKRLLELDPEDAGLRASTRQIEASIQERQVEQLSGMALGYAADGDMELAHKIAKKIAQLAPESPKYLELKRYLDEESARTTAEALTSTAREHLALGNLDEARAAAEEALEVYPAHAVAREIRDRATTILAAQDKASHRSGPPETTEAPVGAPTPPVPESVGPDPDAEMPATVAMHAVADGPPAGAPASPLAGLIPVVEPAPVVLAPIEAAPAEAPPVEPGPREAPPIDLAPAPVPEEPAPVAPAPVEAAARVEAPPATDLAPAPAAAPVPAAPAPALPSSAPPAAAPPVPTPDTRRSEAAALMTSALNHFVQNNYPRAKKAAEKALALDPDNKNAKELMKILGALS